MKFVLEERDEKFINGLNKDIAENKNNTPFVPLSVDDMDKRYYIEFKCSDIAKANNFILTLLNHNEEFQQHIKDTLGIDVLALNYRGLGDISDIKEDLIKVVNKLERM